MTDRIQQLAKFHGVNVNVMQAIYDDIMFTIRMDDDDELKQRIYNEKLQAMWADPRFQILADLDHLFHGSKIWAGMEWIYHPIHPAKYRPMAERVRAELGKLYKEYGVEE